MSQSLKKVNSRLYTTLDSIKTGIIYCNEEGTVKVINEGAVKLLGIKKDLKDVPGTNVCPYFDSKLSMDKIAANTKNGETYCYELVSSGCPDFVYNGTTCCTAISAASISAKKSRNILLPCRSRPKPI